MFCTGAYLMSARAELYMDTLSANLESPAPNMFPSSNPQVGTATLRITDILCERVRYAYMLIQPRLCG